MNVIQINGLTKAYGGTRAVDGLNMRVGQGDIYGFVGKNGAGKTCKNRHSCAEQRSAPARCPGAF